MNRNLFGLSVAFLLLIMLLPFPFAGCAEREEGILPFFSEGERGISAAEKADLVSVKSDGVFLLSETNYGTAFRILTVPEGSVLRISEDCGRYYKVTTEGEEPISGFVLKDDVSEVFGNSLRPRYPTVYCSVISEKTLLRRKPSESGGIRTLLDKGESLRVYGNLGEEWIFVSSGGAFGYVKRSEVNIDIDASFLRRASFPNPNRP